jgi:hypothetical protein
MDTAVLVSVMGLLTVVAIYFLWGRKIAAKSAEPHPAEQRSAQ